MNIPATTNTLGLTGTTATASPAQPNRGALSSDFETFLKMLTAQARYQDPLEPIDSTEYAAQLAQFSMVEQQVQTNGILAALHGQTATGSMTNLAAWVGMEARAIAPGLFDGAPITLSPNPASVADEAAVVVFDASGAQVQRLTIPVSAEPFIWDGVDEDGMRLPDDSYSFTIESLVDGEVILSEPAEIYARVTEAQVRGGDTILILEGGHAIPANSVTALRSIDV